MANSKLLKEAIADAKAVKETALANAKLALEEAFTPRLQSILAAKMQAEAQKEEEEEMKNEELKSDEIGTADKSGENPGKMPKLDAHTDLSVGVKKSNAQPGKEDPNRTIVNKLMEDDEMGTDAMKQDGDKDAKIAELEARVAELEGSSYEEESYEEEEEGENPFAQHGDDSEMGGDDEMGGEEDYFGDDDEHDKDDMDLEAIIRELEAQLEGSNEEEEEGTMYESEEEEEEVKNESYSDGSDAGTDKSEDPKVVNNETKDVTGATGHVVKGSFDQTDEVIDLEEILREMEADMVDDKKEEEESKNEVALNEAYATIKSLQKTINEVNLLNAKLLFANKLFRAHNMTNEQKVKVIETLDRTNSVREVKLVYSTLAENFKYTSTTAKTVKKSITEGIASKVTKSTKPAATKQVIAENTIISDRFQKLAGIIK
jgi:hypothetical protein